MLHAHALHAMSCDMRQQGHGVGIETSVITYNHEKQFSLRAQNTHRQKLKSTANGFSAPDPPSGVRI